MGNAKSMTHITYYEFNDFMQQIVGNGELTKKEIKKFRKLQKQLLIPISYRKLKNLQDSISFNPLNKSNDMSYDMSDKEIIAIDDLKFFKDFYNLICELISKADIDLLHELLPKADLNDKNDYINYFFEDIKSAFKKCHGFDMPQSIETYILMNKNLPLKW